MIARATYPRSQIPILGIIAVLAVLLAVLAVPQVMQSVHAVLHEEANEIRKCAASPENLISVWLNSSGERLNCLIRLPDGRIGNYVIQYSCRQLRWIEITAYIIRDGSLAEAIRVLAEKACTQVWGR